MPFLFWQRSHKSIENSSTYIQETCLDCQRHGAPALRAAARPICIMPTYDAAEVQKHVDESHPYADNLPEWLPVGCSYHLPV